MIEPKSVLTGKIFSGEPVVSVCVITYNHGKYIRQCLDGILMQEVTFPYEILIHDDASPDNTAEIIREYEVKYPEIIKPIYQTVNQYSQGIDVGKYNFERAVGKYIALCEGDDYWSDPKKLQMQVDFLEKNPEYMGTAHSVLIVDENGNQICAENGLERLTYTKNHKYNIGDVEKYLLPGQTNTLVYKNIYKTINEEIKKEYYLLSGWGDRKLTATLAALGDIYCFGNTMSAYRYVVITSTSWSAQTYKRNIYGETFKYLIDIQEFVNHAFKRNMKTYEAAFCTYLASLLLYARHPTSENRNAVKKIMVEIHEKPRYMKNGIRWFVSHPLLFVKRTLQISVIRLKTFI